MDSEHILPLPFHLLGKKKRIPWSETERVNNWEEFPGKSTGSGLPTALGCDLNPESIPGHLNS
jgi:hypothetical protein